MTSLHEALAALVDEWTPAGKPGVIGWIGNPYADALRALLDRFPAPDPAPSERVELTEGDRRQASRGLAALSRLHDLAMGNDYATEQQVSTEYDAVEEWIGRLQERVKESEARAEKAEARADALAEQVAAAEALAGEWAGHGYGVSLYESPGELADALRERLSSPGTALARVRAEAGAKALEDAAEDVEGPDSDWLRERAAGLRAGVES